MRDLDKQPYNESEARVAKFFFDRGTGGGDDPIGAILASHEALAAERNELKRWKESQQINWPMEMERRNKELAAMTRERNTLLNPTEAMLGAMAMVLVDWLGRQPVHAMLEEAYKAAVAKRNEP